MAFRFLPLLTALLMLTLLSGCGTDTKTSQGISGESDVSVITSAVATSKHSLPVGAAVNSCTNCHAAGGAIYKNGPTSTSSAENETCGTACHTALLLPVITMKPIIDTHFDDKTTANSIEGYVIRATAASACRDCHDSHTTALTIQNEWAESGHAGEIVAGPVQDDLTVTPPIYSPWAHYNWDDNASRSACQRCHTATGAANFLNDPARYNAADNDFSHLADWTTGHKTSGQNELLYCWGCHSDAEKGELRNPGALDLTFSNGAAVSYSDAAHSNLCIACHAGRETGNSIKNSTAAFNNTGFVNSHYLAAAGTLYAKSGYDFANKDYRSSLGFRHDMTGINAPLPASVKEKGPCVYCHMGSYSNHTWKITNDEACDLCHAGTAFSLLTAGKNGYESALEVLKAALDAEGFFFYPAHPYFYTSPYDPAYTESGLCAENLPVKNWQAGGTSTFVWDYATPTATAKSCVSSAAAPGTADTGKDRMGAAYNYNLLIHEPGAFVHNSLYSKRLIFDSIDWLDGDTDLDGNQMDGQITIDAAYADARLWLNADALTGIAIRP